MKVKFSDEEFYVIKDGSYSVEITPEGRIGNCRGIGYQGKTYLLIGHAVNLPTRHKDVSGSINNMILKGGDGSIVITHSRFVKKLPVCPKCYHILTEENE